jgi:hypothetical protein
LEHSVDFSSAEKNWDIARKFFEEKRDTGLVFEIVVKDG